MEDVNDDFIYRKTHQQDMMTLAGEQTGQLPVHRDIKDIKEDVGVTGIRLQVI